MKKYNTITALIVIVPLFVLFVMGTSCGLLSQLLDWADGKCRDWFDRIWNEL